MANHGVYTTLNQLKNTDIKAVRDVDDLVLMRYIIEASRDFEKLASGRLFYPRLYSKKYDFTGSYDDICLRDDLLEITTFTTLSGNTTLTSSDYFLKSGNDYDNPPYDRIEVNSSSSTVLNFSSTPQAANEVTGYWGYIPHWSSGAWISSGDTISSASGTQVTVTDVVGVDVLFRTPRFQIGQLIKWDVSSVTEYAFIIDIDEDNNILKVARESNGTTLTTPVGSEAIDIFYPDEGITKAVRRLAAWYYRQKGSSNPDADRVIITSTGVITPESFPRDVKDLAISYRSPFR